MEYLTQKQVDELAAGTEILITWSGGNGPHRYIITKRAEQSYSTFIDTEKKRHIGERLDFVGNAPPFTMVRLAVNKIYLCVIKPTLNF